VLCRLRSTDAVNEQAVTIGHGHAYIKILA
jgi:hypothetical protein